MSNDTQTLNLTDFLLARITEDEAVARAGLTCGQVHPTMDVWCPDGHPDPRAVATCKAHRAIVEPWASGDGAKILDLWSRSPELDPPIEVNNAIVVLRALASIYADHADFRSEWAL